MMNRATEAAENLSKGRQKGHSQYPKVESLTTTGTSILELKITA